eukprot:COSAG06_NODE_14996_length_1107_cov_3.764881_2_plen_124_part_00
MLKAKSRANMSYRFCMQGCVAYRRKLNSTESKLPPTRMSRRTTTVYAINDAIEAVARVRWPVSKHTMSGLVCITKGPADAEDALDSDASSTQTSGSSKRLTICPAQGGSHRSGVDVTTISPKR